MKYCFPLPTRIASCHVCFGLILTLFCGNLAADPLTRSIDISRANTRQEVAVQKQINKLDDATRKMLAEYQRLSRELDVATRYHNQLERLVNSQQEEKQAIATQMLELESTQREIIPLMLNMVDALDDMVSLDIPFLLQERHQRIAHLHELMDRADVSIGEKYRRILDAYQIEMEYGRTIEAYQGDLDEASGKRAVDFLRFGRIGLYYQTLDREESGYWNTASHNWVKLPPDYRHTVRRGIRIARKQAAPELLRLPVPAPVDIGKPEESQP